MKPNRKLFRSALALILALAAVPSWACLRSCNTGSQSLECLRLCSRSHALLTQDGELASMSSQDCGVSLEQAPAVLGVGVFQLEAPGLTAVLAQPVQATPALPALTRPHPSRGPPQAGAYLSSQHPFANGPPTLL